jgi:hypothetical protein
MRHEKFRTFSDICGTQRLFLQDFYNISEQIACWYSSSARLGYEGGTAMRNRSRTEEVFCDLFGDHGSAAIMLYIMRYYAQLKATGKGLTIDHPEYIDRFKDEVWFKLAKTLMLDWHRKPLESIWIKEVRRLNRHLDEIRVRSLI